MKLAEDFGKAQQDQVDRFKILLKKAAEDVIGSLYTDVWLHAADDAHVNFRNYLRDEFKDSLIKEISSEYGHYSWAHNIRMDLLKRHPEILKTKIIEDLQTQVQSLKEHLEQMRDRRTSF